MLERATVAGSNTWVMHVNSGGTVRELVRALATSEDISSVSGERRHTR